MNKKSKSWKVGNAIATVTSITDDHGITGSCGISLKGKPYGPWSGGKYGIGVGFRTEQQAIMDMAVFLFWEIEKYEFPERVSLLELIGRGPEAANYDPADDPIDQLLGELREWQGILHESEREIIRTSEQLFLF